MESKIMNSKETEQSNKNELIYVVGDKMVGKTALLSALTGKSIKTKLTMGVDFQDITLQVQNDLREFSFIDLGGAEPFHKFYEKYVEEASGGIFVFDLTNRKSFENIPYYFDLIKDIFEGKPAILVGNKRDLEREITFDEAQVFAKENNIPYFETSALTKEGVNEAISFICELVLD